MKKSCFPDNLKVLSVVLMSKYFLGEVLVLKLKLLSAVNQISENLLNNNIVGLNENCGCFLWFLVWFRSSPSNVDLLTGKANKLVVVFNMCGAFWAVALDLSKAFERFWHAGLYHKLKSHGIYGQVLLMVLLHFLLTRCFL